MNNLLVLTNFTPSSYNAAQYAMHIAKNTRANITLCHVISSANEHSRKEKMDSLRSLAERMMQEDRAVSNISGYNPIVDFVCKSGKVAEVAARVFEEQDIALAVMGMSGSGGGLFSSSTSKEIIDQADFPLIAVPVKATFTGLNKIAFATNLREADTNVVSAITEFARPLNTEILLAHVTNEKFDNNEHKLKVTNFINNVNNKANYGKIFYRHIKSMDVDHGLNWLANNGNVNMLALVHRRQKTFSLFESSHTHQLAKSTGLPLLVYPMVNAFAKVTA